MIFVWGALAAIAFFGLSKGAEVVSEVIDENDNWTKYDSLFKKYGAIYSVDWTYLKAICLNESSLGAAKSVKIGLENPQDVEGSKSSDGKSWGLMQMTLPTARDLDPSASEVKLNNPDYSIKLSAQYVGQLQKKFSMLENRWLEWVIKSYNQGPGNTAKERAGKIDGYAETYWERFQRNLERVNS